MRNNFFIKTICVILMTALLTFSVGRATRVSAVATTAAVAGLAFIATGAVYMSYLALTQGQMTLPVVDDVKSWLSSIGHKVSQYPSGAAAYQEIYQGLLRDPLADVIDGVWTWTQDKLRSFANDFSDTRIISDIVTYYEDLDVHTQILNRYEYPFTILPVHYVYYGTTYSLGEWISSGYIPTYGTSVLVPSERAISYLYDGVTYRNILFTDNTYGVQYLSNGNWFTMGSVLNPVQRFVNNGVNYDFSIGQAVDGLTYSMTIINNVPTYHVLYPLLTQADTYIEESGEVVEAQLPVVTRIQPPSWTDPDNDNRPIIPYVPIPQLPVNYTPPTGYVDPQWGFNLQDLLDTLEDLAGTLMDIGAIASLINGFAGLHGDEYYISYNEGDTNFYTYYQPANTYNYDDYYVTNYNIDVSDVDEHLPVDLNTISQYTNNTYVDTVKSSAQKGSTILRDFFVFWHDVDAELVYVLFGCAIVTLVGAFIGKWGHS